MRTIKQVSKIDRTTKLLFELADGARVEGVLLYNGPRISACLSSQAGCACGCRFCATAAVGFRRDLTADEIVAQYEICAEEAGRALDSIVFMGMGEPLLNWENLKESILRLSDQRGIALPQSRMTVSTIGIVPKINELARSGVKVRLAISIVTADEEQRRGIVPMEQKYPLSAIMAAAKDYCDITGRQVFLEYILFAGFNDSAADAAELLKRVEGLDCKINLILYNNAREGYAAPSITKAKEFQDILVNSGKRTYLRHEKGADINAACGQLALRSGISDE